MLMRLSCCLLLIAALSTPQGARANCAEKMNHMMSKETEKLVTRFNRIAKRIEQRGATPRLVAEECRIARQLKPKLESQLAALRQSGCLKDPQMGPVVADIVRGHEDDLALARKSIAQSRCQ